MRPDAGRVRIDGVDAAKSRAHIGYVGHESMLDQTLTVRENLMFFGRLYGVASPAARCDALIDRIEARPIADTPVGDLSRGQEQLAALGRALMHEPAVLLLDEPSTGLDPAAHSRLARLLKEEASRGACVFYSTHDATLLPAADRTLRLVKGGLA
jgi:ABC-type multidrug transport system ATPase subunit